MMNLLHQETKSFNIVLRLLKLLYPLYRVWIEKQLYKELKIDILNFELCQLFNLSMK